MSPRRAGATLGTLRKLLLCVTLLATPFARAHKPDSLDPAAIAAALEALSESCQLALTPNEEYARLREEPPENMAIGVTRLMNSLLHPVVKRSHDYVTQLPAKTIQRDAERWTNNITVSTMPISIHRLIGQKQLDTAYDGQFLLEGEWFRRAAYTHFNHDVIERLTRAITLLHRYNQRLKAEFKTMTAVGNEILANHSFSVCNVLDILDQADLTVINSVTQLTANPVEDLSAEDIFTRIMTPTKAGLSLINRLALAAPSGAIPEAGQFFYVKDPLVISRGQLRLSPRYRKFLDNRRQAFRRRVAHSFEMGKGCPLGHRHPVEPTTGVQLYLDAVMHIYRTLEVAPHM